MQPAEVAAAPGLNAAAPAVPPKKEGSVRGLRGPPREPKRAPRIKAPTRVPALALRADPFLAKRAQQRLAAERRKAGLPPLRTRVVLALPPRSAPRTAQPPSSSAPRRRPSPRAASLALQPPSQAASQAASQPASELASQPGSQPASQSAEAPPASAVQAAEPVEASETAEATEAAVEVTTETAETADTAVEVTAETAETADTAVEVTAETAETAQGEQAEQAAPGKEDDNRRASVVVREDRSFATNKRINPGYMPEKVASVAHSEFQDYTAFRKAEWEGMEDDDSAFRRKQGLFSSYLKAAVTQSVVLNSIGH